MDWAVTLRSTPGSAGMGGGCSSVPPMPSGESRNVTPGPLSRIT